MTPTVGGDPPPISDYALLSDGHGAALVGRDGSVDWCCLRRFDGRPVFARLLDRERGGYFRIAPAEAVRSVSRRYRPGTLILETIFETERGRLALTDLMVVAERETGGSGSGEDATERPVAENRLVRLVRCERGPVAAEVDWCPRFDYGLTVPHLRTVADGLLATYGGADAMVLQSSAPLRVVEEGRARGRIELEPGEEACFVASYHLPHHPRAPRLPDREVRRRLRWTHDFWSRWIGRCEYEGEYADAVRTSALVLKALTSVPTGAIVAAPTTSLPEDVGGVRNWDYRFTWLRDASFVLDALFTLGYAGEAERFMAWLHRTTAGRPQDLQIMYGAGGERHLPEVEREGVRGYRDSRPVRTGNAAARQFQLDIYGDVLHVAWRHHVRGGSVDDDLWALLRSLADYVVENWERPDHGLWEVRTGPRPFVHSKVMAWVALDRALRLAAELGREAAPSWRPTRAAIRRRVLDEGTDGEGRFRRAFGEAEPDAAALLFPVMGFVEAGDPRAVATRRWIEERLRDGCLLRRYRGGDGLPGREGAFVACSFWLVEVLAMEGRTGRARELFEALLERRSDLGLLSEQLDPVTGALLGNHPQALSHIGLINAAVALQRAGRAPEAAAAPAG